MSLKEALFAYEEENSKLNHQAIQTEHSQQQSQSFVPTPTCARKPQHPATTAPSTAGKQRGIGSLKKGHKHALRAKSSDGQQLAFFDI